MKTNFYVDAFNLYYGALKGTPHKWLDLAALFGRVFPRNDIHRIRYFTARVDRRSPHFQQHQRQQAYLRALATIPGLSIHYGQFRTRPTLMPLANPRRVGPKTVRVRSLDLRPTFLKQLRRGPIAASQFAPVLHDASGGGEIRKPKGW